MVRLRVLERGMAVAKTFEVGTVIVLALVVAAHGAPIVGTYASEELGGEILDGRWSESYVGGGPGQIGNAVHASSWDGSTLATQWDLSGPAINAVPVVLLDTRVGGTGTVVYYTTYSGGTLLLKDTGPWWSAGDPGTEYSVTVSTYAHTTTNEYVGGQLVASTTVVALSGSFTDYPGYTVSFWVAVAVPLGEGSGPPSGYPAYVPETATRGVWGIAQKIRTEIVPEPVTMGVLCAGLGILTVRRRGNK